MASERMVIPQKINVGYQERQGTYTGKLAYVVWTDSKGVIRKEASWKSWTKEQLGRDVFDNEPLEGFVLNKGVGGARESHGWNPRNEYIRVYDPRGFEFEISVANLLFILQESSSVKGKGLEGQFVYSWEGKDLVLLPVSSKEYQSCLTYTKSQSSKISKTDIIEGAIYQMRDMTKVMYLGRHDLYLPAYFHNGAGYVAPQGKKHIFLNMSTTKKRDRWNPYGPYIIQTGFTKLASRLTDEADPTYAEEFWNFKNSINGSPMVDCEITKTEFPFEKFERNRYYLGVIFKDNNYYVVEISYGYCYTFNYIQRQHNNEIQYHLKVIGNPINTQPLLEGKIDKELGEGRYGYFNGRGNITLDKIKEMEFFKIDLKNEAGITFNFIGGHNE